MEAKGLMIGDLLAFDDGYFEEVRRVTEIWDDGIQVVGSTSVCDDAIEFCTPIELKDDIMHKNGFVMCVGADPLSNYYVLEGLFILVAIMKTEGKHFSGQWSVDYLGQRTARYGVFTCGYVHELQHFLRVAGYSELADNFKL